MSSKIRLLIVEDEALVARDLESMAQRAGYEVCATATTGEEALNMALTMRPDLALIDIIIKGSIDGIDVARKIWQDMQIPAIYVTAYADDSTLKRARETAPFGYILKPFDERELRVAVETAIYKSQMELKLRDREKWLGTILQNIDDAVIATDNEGKITYLNPSAEKLTGWRRTEALAKPLAKVFRIVTSQEKHAPPEVFLQSKKGELIPVEYTVTPLKVKSPQISGEVIVLRNISERRRAEKEIMEGWKRLQQALEGTIQALALTIEIRDPYTAGHQRRVSELACALAKEMGMPSEELQAIKVAGDIHDIGKISVPVEILGRPSKLNEVEFGLIKTHPQVGYDILKNIDFPWPVPQIVLQHHERIDGSGYPSGLKGEEILLEARIIAVADTVEAMASHRPYRPALGIEKALAEIMKFKGILYDSEVVDNCVRLFRSGRFQWS